MFLPREHRQLSHARQLRRNLTPEERHLWFDFLQSYPQKIYKQRIIGDYIADFYCRAAKLVIEIDGSQHYETDGMEYDKIRTEYMQSLGLMVIRFSNADINRQFQAVCESIDDTIRKRLGGECNVQL